MTKYTAFYVDHAGLIVGAQSINSPSAEDALHAAHRVLVGSRFPTIEVWDASQRIGAIDRELDAPV